MFSMPPATATSILPSAISWAADTIAWAPEPQTRLTVSAGVVTGKPACTAACCAGFIFVPAWTTLPMTTVSTSSGRMPARATAAPIAVAPGVGAGTSLRLPPKVPIAVRAGSANTTERDIMTNLHSRNAQTAFFASNLRKTAVDEELDSCDVTRVIGGEKQRRLGDFIGRAKSAKWRRGVNYFPALFTHRTGSQQRIQPWSIDGAGADRIHADTARLQIRGPGSRKRARDCLCRRINAVCW